MRLSFARTVILAAALLAATAHAAPPLPGAIFTTTKSGAVVNGNIYAAKCDVYLDGGPGPNAPQGAAGLPDGDYYFQVTDPSGKTLLSTDIVAKRGFHVTNGIIASVTDPAAHPTFTDLDHGGLTIRLCAFNDTPNKGGEYKVWVTPAADFRGDVNQVDSSVSGTFHGFVPAASKTDNFKVRSKSSPTACLTIQKFADLYDLGQFVTGYYYIPWSIYVTAPSGDTVQGLVWTLDASNKNPALRLCNLPAGDYTVTEIQRKGCTVTANRLDGRYLTPFSESVKVTMRGTNRELVFGNVCKDDNYF